MLAVLSWQRGQCQEAVLHFEKAGALVETNKTAKIEYGSCLLALGENQRAEDLFLAMMKEESTPENRIRYAYAAWKNKDFAPALDVLQPLISGTSPSTNALALSAQIAEDQGDTPHAVQWLRQAIITAPQNDNNYLLFATISFNHASYQVGIDMINVGLQVLPGDARLYLARGVLFVQLSNSDRALADFQKAHQLDPKLSFAEDAMGMMHSQKHESASALAIFRRQAELHPDDSLLQYLYAEALSEEGEEANAQNTALAIAAATRAIKLEPSYQPARDLLCLLYLRANDLTAVIAQAEEAIKIDPADETAMYQELMAYRRLGKKDDVDKLVARMKTAHQQQQKATIKYVVQEVVGPSETNP
jgi:tetratricopeptide (TPR) repeat protein